MFVTEEIATQADCWRQAGEVAAQVSAALPQPGERVAFSGCGSSWFASMAMASLIEAAGIAEADAFTCSEFPLDRKYDRVIVTTRSGTTTEAIELLSALKDTPTTVITAVPGSPVTALADQTIEIPFADERSVVQTRSATSAIALVRAHAGTPVTAFVGDVQAALQIPVDELAGAEQVTFLGTGWTVGLANEAALKTREAAQFWAEAYPAMDYRHGPISIAEPGRLVWAFGPLPAGLEDDVQGRGATVVRHDLDPLAALIVAQRFAVAAAVRRGLDPDQPRGLARSIILT